MSKMKNALNARLEAKRADKIQNYIGSRLQDLEPLKPVLKAMGLSTVVSAIGDDIVVTFVNDETEATSVVALTFSRGKAAKGAEASWNHAQMITYVVQQTSFADNSWYYNDFGGAHELDCRGMSTPEIVDAIAAELVRNPVLRTDPTRESSNPHISKAFPIVSDIVSERMNTTIRAERGDNSVESLVFGDVSGRGFRLSFGDTSATLFLNDREIGQAPVGSRFEIGKLVADHFKAEPRPQWESRGLKAGERDEHGILSMGW
ncbi:hypothetical protein [Rhizobium leguminosarum]|uniref:hypothetical protein n=1 Tax=Rhizobium leguminosarum TaxID=384 RepID=UPI000374FB25|nr:hypothetical protein [Rhizobium leguminosarum]